MPPDTDIAASPDRAATRRKRACSASPRPPAFNARATGAALKILRREAAQWNAPVLTLMSAEEDDPFKTLIGCILSLRTKDQTTAVAAPRLFEMGDTPEALLRITPGEIERLIYPVGFYRTKARVIQDICRDLLGKFGGRVPDEI